MSTFLQLLFVLGAFRSLTSLSSSSSFEDELNQIEADYDMPPPPDTRLTNWGWTQASDRSADPYAASSRRGRYLGSSFPPSFHSPPSTHRLPSPYLI